MKDMNDWLFITTSLVQENSDKAKTQCNLVLEKSLDLHVETFHLEIKINKFGAISSGDHEPFWLDQWQGPPHQLTVETMVEGSDIPMPVGTWVCHAVYFDRIPQTRQWYERMKTPNMLFWLQHVSNPDVAVDAYNQQQGNIPPLVANGVYSRETAPTCIKHISENIINLTKCDTKRLAKLELRPLHGEQEDIDEDDDDNNIDDEEGEPETFQNIEGNNVNEDEDYEVCWMN